MSDRKTVVGAYEVANDALQRISSHEELCAERYRRIDEGLGRLDVAITGHRKIALGVMGAAGITALSLIGWLGAQVWDAYKPSLTPPAINAGPIP